MQPAARTDIARSQVVAYVARTSAVEAGKISAASRAWELQRAHVRDRSGKGHDYQTQHFPVLITRPENHERAANQYSRNHGDHDGTRRVTPKALPNGRHLAQSLHRLDPRFLSPVILLAVACNTSKARVWQDIQRTASSAMQ
jgi:hypothetical protein